MKESPLFSFHDLFETLKRRRVLITSSTLLFSLLTFFYFIKTPATYEAKGSYRDSQKEEPPTSLAQLAFGDQDTTAQIISTMESSKILESVAKKFNLQGNIVDPLAPNTFWERILSNLHIQWAHIIKKETIDHHYPSPPLFFSEVEYSGNQTLPLQFSFQTPTTYIVKSPYGTIGEGTLGKPFRTNHFSFTLHANQEITKQTFDGTLTPLHAVLKGIRSRFQAKTDIHDRSYLLLTYSDPNPKNAESILNGIMSAYEDHLQECCDRKANKQISYLQKRKKELLDELKGALVHHATSIDETGFFDLDKEMEFLFAKKMKSLEKIHELGLQIERIEGSIFPHTGQEFSHIQQVLGTIEGLKLQKQTLAAAISLPPSGTPNALDLPTATELYLNLKKSVQQSESEQTKIASILEQLKDPTFEISCLSGCLTDRISQDIIQKSSAFSLDLHDEKYHSSKEHDRAKQEIETQKNFLQSHLAQILHIGKEQQELLKTKANELLGEMYLQVNQKLTLQENALSDILQAELTALTKERDHQIQYSNSLQETISTLPEQWASEQLLKQNIALNKSIAEELSKLVEKHVIHYNLDTVESSPLDLARTNPLPTSPGILAYSFLGALIGFVLSSSASILYELLAGVRATRYTLETLGYKTLSNWRTLFVPPKATLLQFKASDLAAHLQHRGHTVLQLNLDFSSSPSPLFAYLDDGLVPPHPQNDILLASSNAPYAVEKLLSPRFAALLDNWKHQYDYILLTARIDPLSPEGKALSTLANFSLFPLKNQKIDELSFYLNQTTIFI